VSQKPQPQTPNIVKDIFDKPKKESRNVSPIFTHKKDSAKVISPQKKRPEIPPNIKPLPTAIDISSTTVKVLRLGENEKRQLETVCVDKEYCNETSIKAAIRKLAERNPLGRQCILNLPLKDTQTYNMMFPPMQNAELQSAVSYKLNQQKPFGLSKEKIIQRWKVWDIPKGIERAKQQRVIAACLPRESVEKRINLVKECGFTVIGLEAPQFSLINLGRFYRPSLNKDDVKLWVHLGHTESFLALEKDRKLCFARNIALTSTQMVKAISRQCRVSEEEAEVLMKNYGFGFWSENKHSASGFNSGSQEGQSGKSESVYYALISLLENLVVDIEHSFKYFSYQIAQSQITSFQRIILSGGASNLININKFLNVRLGVPVDYFNTFDVFSVPNAVRSEKPVIMGEAATFALPAAFSIGQKITGEERVDFLPEKEKGILLVLEKLLQRPAVRAGASAVLLAVLIIALQGGKAAYYKAKMNGLTKQFKETKFNVSKLETRQVELAKEEGELIYKKELLEAQLALLKKGFRGKKNLSVALSSMANLLPEEIWVNELKFEEGRLFITGSTVDLALITQLIDSIKESTMFDGASFSYTQKESGDIYTFEVITNIKI